MEIQGNDCYHSSVCKLQWTHKKELFFIQGQKSRLSRDAVLDLKAPVHMKHSKTAEHAEQEGVFRGERKGCQKR